MLLIQKEDFGRFWKVGMITTMVLADFGGWQRLLEAILSLFVWNLHINPFILSGTKLEP